MYNRMSQIKSKFCDSGQMIGEVIIKWFYFLLFSISSTIRASNVQKPKPKNTLCACAIFFEGGNQWIMPLKIVKKKRGFFGWVKIWKIMQIYKKCCEIKFPKIREKVFYNCSLGGWTKLKNEYIFEPYVTQAFFCPRLWNVSRKKTHFGTP